MRLPSLALVASLACAACDDTTSDPATTVDPGDDGSGKEDRGGIPVDWTSRVESTWLHIDLSDKSGEASIWFEPGDQQTVSLEAGDLVVDDVYDDDGPVKWQKKTTTLNIQHAVNDGPIHIDYHFAREKQGEGYAKNGSTVIWPYYCGNLFPCRSEPSDGSTFELAVSGYPSGSQAIYPESIPAEAPPYTLAFAVGKYTCQDLGKTKNRTTVSVCWLPNGKAKALAGTKSLVAAFDWLEQHIGRYSFGKKVASVAVSWGVSAAGGMEHHPFWHIATSEMELPITHVHEAVHGWYGTGVRMACWEDFVLSEGTTTYLSTRALGQVTNAATEKALWDDNKEELLTTLEDEDIVAWPQTCGKMDILKDGLFSNIVYMKGAFFWKAVADEVGPDVLDAVLARFYEQHVGTAVSMAELIAAVETDTGYDPAPLVEHWLRSKGNPF
ncbi:MAG: M1 family aminopeptidase [Myxococcota bacterium]